MCVCVNSQIAVMLLHWWILHRSGLPKMSVLKVEMASKGPLMSLWMKGKQAQKQLLCKIACKNKAVHIYLFPLFFYVAWMVRQCFLNFILKGEIYAHYLYYLCYYIQCCFLSLFFLRCLRRIDSRQILVRIAFCTFISCRIKSGRTATLSSQWGKEEGREVREKEGGREMGRQAEPQIISSFIDFRDTW